MVEQKAGHTSEGARSSQAILVSKSTVKYEDGENGASNDQTAVPIVQIMDHIVQRPAVKQRSGIYRKYMVLESTAPFSIETTMNIEEGPMTGFEAIIVKPSKRFRFLELPRELRDQIYSFASASKRRVTYRRKVKRLYGYFMADVISHTKIQTPGLFLACHQLYAESLPVVYRHAIFKADDPWSVKKFLDVIGESARLIKTLTITQPEINSLHQDADVLLKLVNLTRLELVFAYEWQPEPLNAIKAAGEFYNFASNWIQLVGSIKGDKYAAVDVIVSKYSSREWNAEFRAELKIWISKRSDPFPFCRLPRSARLRIYELAMTDQSRLVPGSIAGHSSESQPGGVVAFHQTRRNESGVRVVDRVSESFICRLDSLTSGLLRVSRAIYHESLPILYSKNTFLFCVMIDFSPHEFHRMITTFFSQIGDSAIYIKRFAVEKFIPVSAYLTKLVHLDKLYMPMEESTEFGLSSPVDAAQDFYRRERRWIEGVSTFRGDRTAVMDIISPTTGCQGMDMISANHATWELGFRAELRRLLLANEMAQ